MAGSTSGISAPLFIDQHLAALVKIEEKLCHPGVMPYRVGLVAILNQGRVESGHFQREATGRVRSTSANLP
jgi:hypothetical protein